MRSVCCRYELCNEYGLYVMDEANVETHGFDPHQTNNEARVMQSLSRILALKYMLPSIGYVSFRRCACKRVYRAPVISPATQHGCGKKKGVVGRQVVPANSPAWTACILDRGARMVGRDCNHPCVIIWSLGNESGYGPAHLAMAGTASRFFSRCIPCTAHRPGCGFVSSSVW